MFLQARATKRECSTHFPGFCCPAHTNEASAMLQFNSKEIPLSCYLPTERQSGSHRSSGGMWFNSHRRNSIQPPCSLSVLQTSGRVAGISRFDDIASPVPAGWILPGDVDFCSVRGKHGHPSLALIDCFEKTGQV